ncbi:MAG: rhodanese-like domain-containing protein [Nitrospira sp.]|nr:rhodanese-like domain-containing protein [Nitrospira sp.]
MKNSMRQSLSLAVGAVLVLASPGFTKGLPPTVKQKVDTPQKHVRTIGMDEYRKLAENPGSALIVDVREAQEYATGHVPGAINIPRGLIESQIWNHVGSSEKTDMEKPIVLQCQSGKRATLAAQSLQDLGFTHTTAVIMNLDDWQKTGNPFIK